MDFSAIKTLIEQNIRTNNNEDITGSVLQNVLLGIIETLGDDAINGLITALGQEVINRQNAVQDEAEARSQADNTILGKIANILNGGYLYQGVAGVSTNPGNPTVSCFYFAKGAGTYNNFRNGDNDPIVITDNGLYALTYEAVENEYWEYNKITDLDDGVFDISRYHASGGTLATYADLSAALGTNGANVPATFRRGGMSIKFVQSSDNKYVQFRLMLSNFTGPQFGNPANWQGVEDVPTPGSKYLITSGGVNTAMGKELNKIIKVSMDDQKKFIIDANNYVLEKGYASVENGGLVINSTFNRINLVNSGIKIIKISGGSSTPAVANMIGRKGSSYEEILDPLNQSSTIIGYYNVSDYDEIIINVFGGAYPNTFELFPFIKIEDKGEKTLVEDLYITNDNVSNTVNNAIYTIYDFPRVLSGYKYCVISTLYKYETIIVGAGGANSVTVLKRNSQGELSSVANNAGKYDISDASEVYLNFLPSQNRQYYFISKSRNEIIAGLNAEQNNVLYDSSNLKVMDGYVGGTEIVKSSNFHFAVINTYNAKTLSVLSGNDAGASLSLISGIRKNDGAIIGFGNTKGVFNVESYDYVLMNLFGGAYPEKCVVSYYEHIFDNVVLKPFDFSGKTALFVGDSITAGYVNGQTIDQNNNWPKLFSEHFNLASYENRAVGGACISTVSRHAKISDQLTDADDFDYLFVAGGTNDCSASIAISTFRTAVQQLLSDILGYMASNPNLKVIFVTPISHCLPGGRLNLQKYRNVLSEEVLKSNNGRISLVQGNQFPFPEFCDDYSYITSMFGDLTHPSALGYRVCYLGGMIQALT